MGCAVTAVFFLRFWQQSRDRLFAWFAAAFLGLALSYALLGLLPSASEWQVPLFVLRLLAFCLILVAIIDKNRS